MSSQELQIVINAKDKTDQAFKSVNDNLNKAEQRSGSFGKAAKIAFAAGTAAVVAFGAVAKSMVQDYIKDQKDMALANSVLQKSFDSLTKEQVANLKKELGTTHVAFTQITDAMEKAGQAALNLGYDDEAASIGFAKLFQVTGDLTQAQKDMQLAMDLSAFSGKTLEESVSAVTKIHAGGTKILKDFGIEVAEGTTVMDALALANDKVAGTAEKMSQTLSVQMEIIKNRFDNFKSGLGGSIIKAIFGTDDEAVAIDKFKEKVNQVFTFLEAHKDTIATVLVAPFKFLYDVIQGLVQAFTWLQEKFDQLYQYLEDIGAIQLFKDMWDGIVRTFNESLKPALQELWAALEPLKPFLEALATVFGAMLVGAVVILAKLLQYMIIVVTEVLTVVTKLATFLAKVFKATLDGIADAIIWVIAKFKELIDWVERALSKIGQVGKSVLGAFGGGKKSKVNDAVISPSGDVISTHPDDYIIATKDPGSLAGGGFVVNINGGNYLSESAAQELGDMIIKQLSFQMRGS